MILTAHEHNKNLLYYKIIKKYEKPKFNDNLLDNIIYLKPNNYSYNKLSSELLSFIDKNIKINVIYNKNIVCIVQNFTLNKDNYKDILFLLSHNRYIFDFSENDITIVEPDKGILF